MPMGPTVAGVAGRFLGASVPSGGVIHALLQLVA